MSSSGSESKSSIPSELRLNAKWDYAIEQFVSRSIGGLALAGLASIVLFRTRSSRVAFSTFGMGIGFGDAYRLSSIEFEKEKTNR
eukprot:gene14639-19663_t